MNINNLFILILFTLGLTSVFSQNKTNLKYPNLHNTDWIIDYPENINNPINSDEKKLLIEAFGEDYNLNKQKLVYIKHFIRNRVSIIQCNLKELEAYKSIPLLSKVLLINNKINRPVFDINNFNPLIYNFKNSENKKIYRYRVDNSNYVIQIKNRFTK